MVNQFLVIVTVIVSYFYRNLGNGYVIMTKEMFALFFIKWRVYSEKVTIFYIYGLEIRFIQNFVLGYSFVTATKISIKLIHLEYDLAKETSVQQQKNHVQQERIWQ